ncbi:MAG: methyltransferase [bacterium]|nr:methyltransferase [bacterium]
MNWIRRRISLPVPLADFIEERLLIAGFHSLSWERLPGAARTELSIYDDTGKALPAAEDFALWLAEAEEAGLPAAEVRFEDDAIAAEGWLNGFRERFRIRRLTPGLRILPPWERDPAVQFHGRPLPGPGADLDVVIEPGQAFGTGDHPTTVGCLKRLEARLARQETVTPACLDIGSGTGVLSIAAKLWGAGRVEGYDIEAASIINSWLNSDLNGLCGQVRFLWGEAESLAEGAWDLVLCNLFMGPILRLIPRMDMALKPGGGAILSGFLSRQAATISAAARGRGWRLEGEDIDDDWVIQEWQKV